MKLFKRTNGVWGVEFTHPLTKKRMRLSTGQRDRALAEREAVRIVADAESGRDGGVTLRDAIEHTYHTHWKTLRAASTFRRNATLVCDLELKLPGGSRVRLGTVPCASVDYGLLKEVVRELRERGSSGATINRKLSLISKAMNEAKNLGAITSVPKMPKQREADRNILFLSAEDEKRMLAAARAPSERKLEDHRLIRQYRKTQTYMSRLLVFLVDTGCRAGETQLVRMEDLTLDGETPCVTLRHTKSGKTRTVPLTPRAAKAARKMVMHPDHGRISGTGLVTRFNRIRDRAKLDSRFTMHTLRHTCATRLVRSGVSLLTVRDWLGHSSVAVTELYTSVAPAEALIEAARRLSQGGILRLAKAA